MAGTIEGLFKDKIEVNPQLPQTWRDDVKIPIFLGEVPSCPLYR